MGLYTGTSSYFSESYGYGETLEAQGYDVAPIESANEGTNYQILALEMISENTEMVNAFNKAIGMEELACLESTGSVEAFYEGVNLSGIFEKIKTILKAILAKIQKIFHTFISKIASVFGSNHDFAKKYRKEVIEKWGQVSSDWEFKGYIFKYGSGSGGVGSVTKQDSKDHKNTAKALIDKLELKGLAETVTTSQIDSVKKLIDAGADKATIAAEVGKNLIGTKNESGFKDLCEKYSSDREAALEEARKIGWEDLCMNSALEDYEKSEMPKSIFKWFRNGEDAKDDLTKTDIESMYGGSIGSMMGFIEDSSKIIANCKKAVDTLNKASARIDKCIDRIQKEALKDNKGNGAGKNDVDIKKSNEALVAAAGVAQVLVTEMYNTVSQFASGALQAVKDCVSQAKAIAVKVIGFGKKMQQESYDYSSEYSTGSSFLDRVRIV